MAKERRRTLQWVSFAVAGLLCLSAAGFWGGYKWFQNQLDTPGPLIEEATLIIEAGSGVRTIAAQLADEGVIERPWLFALATRYLDVQRALQAGEYAFPAGTTLRQTVMRIAQGRTVIHGITIPEGLTSKQIVMLLRADTRLDGKITTIPAEGTLLPETYGFSRGDSREGILARMREAMAETLSTLWRQRAADLPLDSKREAVTLASIVEKETGVADERAMVAGVFLNRLRRGMRLQADPTVVYALTGGAETLDRPLLRKDWQTDSPYNTYRVDGLPPGPIANPGRASLAATLQPASHDYLYFVADGSGGHAFAKSLREHNRNVSKWRAVHRERQQSTASE